MSRAQSAPKLPMGEQVSSAQARFQRVSARKARLVVDLIRGLTVAEASRQLLHQHRPSAVPIIQNVLKSAVANARESEWEGDPESLIIGDAQVNGGPMIKRFRPRAMGRAAMIRKRMSHVTIKLFEKI